METARRELVRSRAGNRCEYGHLLEQFSELRFHIEHIIPRQGLSAKNRSERRKRDSSNLLNLLRSRSRFGFDSLKRITGLLPHLGRIAL